MNEYQKYYNDYWQEGSGRIQQPEQLINKYDKYVYDYYINSNTKVLDIGCGDGEAYAWYVAKKTKNYYGIDISFTTVNKATEKGIKTIISDITNKLSFEDNFFDFVICNGVLEHLFIPENAIIEIKRVLKNNGYLLLYVPNVAYLGDRILLLFGRFRPRGNKDSRYSLWKDAHIRFFTKKSLCYLLEKNNYKIVKFWGAGSNYFLEIPILRKLFPHEILSKLQSKVSFIENIYPSLMAAGFLVLTKVEK